MKIIKERQYCTDVLYELEFHPRNQAGIFYSFACDKNGNMTDELAEPAAESYAYCLAHPEEYQEPVVKRYESDYVEPAEGICHCGNRVILQDEYLGACQCPECGQWYNLFGQELLPPEDWEEPREEW